MAVPKILCGKCGGRVEVGQASCPRCGEPCYRIRATMAVRCEHPEHHGPKVVFIPRECLEIFSEAEVDAAVDWLWEHAHGCPVEKWVGDGTVTP